MHVNTKIEKGARHNTNNTFCYGVDLYKIEQGENDSLFLNPTEKKKVELVQQKLIELRPILRAGTSSFCFLRSFFCCIER
jgi:hypothetical protein